MDVRKGFSSVVDHWGSPGRFTLSFVLSLRDLSTLYPVIDRLLTPS